MLSWEDGRVGKETVGLLIARQVGAFLDQGAECTDWLEETDVCCTSTSQIKCVELIMAAAGGRE